MTSEPTGAARAARAGHTLTLEDSGTQLSFPPGSSTALVGEQAIGLLARVEGPGRQALLLPDGAHPLHGGLRIGEQIAAALSGTRRAALDRATDLLEHAGVADPHERVRARHHQLSALDRQRAQLALVLANDPVLVLAEDPCAGLETADVAAFSASVARLQAERGFTLLVAASAPEGVGRLVQEILIVADGRVIERRRRRSPGQSPASSPSSSSSA